MYNWILIISLSISTFLSRVIGVEIMAGREMNATLRLYFQYVPVAIIAALIITQIISTSNGQMIISLPVLIGCLSTVIAMRFIQQFLPSVIIGIVIGLLARHFL